MKCPTGLVLLMILTTLVGLWPAEAQDSLFVTSQEDLTSILAGDTITLSVEQMELSSLLTLISAARRISIVAGPEVKGPVSINLYDVSFGEALDSILAVGGFTRFTQNDIIFVTSESGRATLPIKWNNMEIRIYEIHHARLEDVLQTINQFLSPSGEASSTQLLAGSAVGGATRGTSSAAGAAQTGLQGSGTGSTGTKGKIVVEDAPEYLKRIDSLIEQLDVPPHETKVFEIDFMEPQELIATLTEFLSPSGKVRLGSRRRLVVQDAPEYLARAAALIEQLDVAPRQVLISAKVLSIALDDDMGLGIDFEYAMPNLGVASPTPLANFPDDFTSVTTGQLGVFSLVTGDHERIVLDALSTRGHVETLAAPELLAVDGEEAEMRVGGNLGFPITVTTENGITTSGTEFLETGTTLKVTPAITDSGVIQLDVHPEVSTGTITGDLPQKQTTEATTTMLVRDGETVLIGGLLNASKQRVRSQVPVLGDIPVLGMLFGRRTWKDTKTELVILITPRIVGDRATPYMVQRREWADESGEDITSQRSDFGRLLEKDRPSRRKSNRGEDSRPAPVKKNWKIGQ